MKPTSEIPRGNKGHREMEVRGGTEGGTERVGKVGRERERIGHKCVRY